MLSQNKIHVLLQAFSILAAVTGHATGSEIRGRVVDSSHQALESAVIAIDEQAFPRRVRTNSSGEYIFEGLPAGEYHLTVSAKFFVLASVGHIQLNKDETLTIPSILMAFDPPLGDCSTDEHSSSFELLRNKPARAALRGLIQDRDGNPLPHASVRVVAFRSRQVSTAATDNLGNFSILDLDPRQEYVIEISAAGFFTEAVSTVSVQAGFAKILLPISLESCKPGYCQPRLKEVRVLPTCA